MKPTYEELEARSSKLADAVMTCVSKVEELQEQVKQLAAENAALKSAAEFATAPDMWVEQANGSLEYRYHEWYVDVLKIAMATPATDAFLSRLRAEGVEMAISSAKPMIAAEFQRQTFEQCVSATFKHPEIDLVGKVEMVEWLGDFAQLLREGKAGEVQS